MHREPWIDLAFVAACLSGVVSGCASSPRARAAQTVIISDALADEVADQWEGFVDSRIESCRQKNLETALEREECLGVAANGETLAGAASSLVLVQQSIKEGLKCEEFNTCVKEVDWNALYQDAIQVFGEFQALSKEMKQVEQ